MPRIHSLLFSTALSAALPMGLFALTPSTAIAQDKVVVQCGTLYMGRGTKPMKDVVVVIENGRIQKIGKDLEIDWQADVIDASKQYVMPAWVLAHSSGGLDRPNENMPMTPYLSILDSLEPAHSFFESARRNGIGAVHVMPGNRTQVGGRGMLVKPYGQTPEEMAYVPKAAMKVSLMSTRGSRSRHLIELEKGFQGALDHRKELQRQKKEWEEEKKRKATLVEEFDIAKKIDPLKKPLLDMLDGKIPCYLYVPGPNDVSSALRLVDKYLLRSVLVLGPRCYEAVDLFKSYARRKPGKLRLILSEQLEVEETDPITKKKTIVCPAKVFWDAGLPFALQTSSGSRSRFRRFGGGGSSHPAMVMPWWQVGTCVRHGVPEADAIAAFTEIPARILNRHKRMGRLTEGMDASLQILRAAPMEPESQVEMLLIEGKVVYDRTKDPRVKALTGKPEVR